MRTHVAVVFSILALSILSGCSGHHVRQGRWKLGIKVEFRETRVRSREEKARPLNLEYVVTLPVLVEVEEGETGDSDLVAIAFLEEPSNPSAAPGAAEEEEGADAGSVDGQADDLSSIPSVTAPLKPMYGEVRVKREGEAPTIQIDYADEYWQGRLWGIVKDSETILGSQLGGRSRQGNAVASGKWFMRWVSDN